MKDNYTHIAVVLDSSGSMEAIKNDTIGGFNTFLEAQKNAEGEATFTMVEFADHNWSQGNSGWSLGTLNLNTKPVEVDKNVRIKVRHDFVDIKEVSKLTEASYRPSGGTPLLDTIGEVIKRTGNNLKNLPESLRPSKVLFVIITDGEENTSSIYSFSKINEMISHQKDVYNWEFVFLGANQDAIREATKMGISAMSSVTYGTSAAAMDATYNMLACKTASFRSTGLFESFNEEERKSAMGDK